MDLERQCMGIEFHCGYMYIHVGRCLGILGYSNGVCVCMYVCALCTYICIT